MSDPRCVSLDGFPDLADLHAGFPERYPHLLESVARGTPQARHDILFAFPGAHLRWDGAVVALDGVARGEGFLDALDGWWRAESRAPAPPSALPFSGGWFLFLSYELAESIEPCLAPLRRDARLPVALATRFPAAIVRDHVERRCWLVSEDDDRADARLARMRADLATLRASPADVELVDWQEEDPDRYRARIARVLDYIRAGDVFQVNLSRGWHARLARAPRPVDVYRRLRAANPAPFAGLMRLDAERAVISSSPERLVSVRDGRIVTRPIAGTYPRGRDAADDLARTRELPRNPKERAEHVMLLDLERNDLGRVCATGSVRVAERLVVESYRHVHHIVSQVEGRLRAGVTPAQVIRAVFPGGTITGCPKVRTMQIIAELEDGARGAYTGSMGYLNRDGSLDLNILIRTLVQDGATIAWRAGGGIVADSQVERELDETRAKARGLLNALCPAEATA
ncbi:MAG TPA: aminodeoxychorismate synthase component I [Acidiferrobacterales bacterium]